MRKMNVLIVLATVSIALVCRCVALEFDLSYVPPEEEVDGVTARMLETAEEITYRSEHENQKLWILRPADLKEGESRPCLFFIHGGGWGGSPDMFAPQCLALSRKGLVCVSIHFRKPGPSPTDCLADSLSAYRWVRKNARQYNIDPDRIIVSGGSAGGHLALAMLTIPGYDHADDDLSIPIDPKALVLFNPAIDLVEGWKGGRAKCEKAKMDPATFSPAHRVRRGLPETLILSGGQDNIISPEMIEQFMKRMSEHDNKCAFILYPEAKHSFFNYGKNENVYFQQTLVEVEKFLARLGYLESNE